MFDQQQQGRGIAQFMWPFQHHFRHGLERVTADVFKQIGFGLGPRAYLVGFTDNPDAAFPICVEPETEQIANADLTGIVAAAEHAYENHPDANTIITSVRHHDRFHRSLHDKMRAQALKQAFEADPDYSDRYFFIGASARVLGFQVHPVISVPRRRWDSKPALHGDLIDDRWTVQRSFQHSLIDEVLKTATRDLQAAEPPEDLSLAWSDRSELIRAAADNLVQSVSVRTGHLYASQVRVALDEVSAQPYEGRAGSGGLLLAAESNERVRSVLRFTTPIRLSETRAVRKALEMTSPNLHLWSDGEKVLGLAELHDAYDPQAQDAYLFTVVGRSTWELSHADTPLLRVSNTRPALPAPRLAPEEFRSITARVFPEANGDDIDRLWKLTTGAADASHGTMLVVHRNAAAESARLVPQSQQVTPTQLNPDVLSTVTNIDGAVLVDIHGQCHAIGVILDGHATGDGDASRGARYNSGVRYQAAQSGDCLVIIVSEDGMVNLLPNLRRVVDRASIESVVAQVEAAADNDPSRGTHFEEFFRTWDHMEAVAFYLTPEQCDRVNAAREKLEQTRADGHGTIVVGWTRIKPDPKLNDTFFN